MDRGQLVRLTGSFKDDFRAKIDMRRADPFYHDGCLHVTSDQLDPDATNQIFTARTGASPQARLPISARDTSEPEEGS